MGWHILLELPITVASTGQDGTHQPMVSLQEAVKALKPSCSVLVKDVCLLHHKQLYQEPNCCKHIKISLCLLVIKWELKPSEIPHDSYAFKKNVHSVRFSKH